MSAAKILIVGGRDGVSALETRVADLGYAVCGAVSSREMVLTAAASTAPDLLLIDLDCEAGAAAADRFQDQSDLPVVYLTGDVDGSVRQRMRMLGSYGCVLKPYAAGQLLLSMDAALTAHQRRTVRERRLNETLEQLREQKQTMEAVFKGISDGVVVTDEQGELIMYNPSAGHILGIGGDDPQTGAWRTSATLFQLDKVTEYPRDEYPIARALRGEETNDLDVFMRHRALPDGAYFNLNGRPLLDENGESSGSVVMFRDVTDRTLATEAVSRAFADGRMEMVDTLLHNVGNAINSVGVGADTIRDVVSQSEPFRRLRAVADALAAHGDDRSAWLENDPKGRNAIPFLLSVVEDLTAERAQLMLTTERVRRRVEHIVDILRTQRSLGRGAADRKQVKLKPAIQAAVRVLQESLDKSGIRVELDCARAPEEIRIQESQFHQMIVNLVKNSIEAIDELPDTDGPQARPRIRIAAYAGKDTLVIDVIDNGAGIAPEHMNALFSAGFSTKAGGSGIGLHSAANFVAGAGGHIEPLSEGPGRGATMRIRLALPPPSSDSSQVSPSP